MSRITVTFERAWLDQCRTAGVRVVRLLEKWVATEADVSLKSSSGNSLTLEMKPASRDGFVQHLAARMKEFGETDPWRHVAFSGDVAGLNLPTRKVDEDPPPQPMSDPASIAAPRSALISLFFMLLSSFKDVNC